jgi:hypothetical protein
MTAERNTSDMPADAGPAKGERVLGREILRVLARTPVARWAHLALLVDDDEDGVPSRIMTRAGLVTWLRANDLRALAAEARSRAAPRGSLLALVISSRAGPGFRVLFDPRRRRGTR